MSHQGVAVIGAGGHAAVVASVLIASGQEVFGFFDDSASTWGTTILGIPVRGALRQLAESGSVRAILGFGDNRARKVMAEQLRVQWVTAVHPFAWVHPGVLLGPGTVVCAGAVVQPGARIGSHVIINTRSSVDHHARVGDYAHLAVAHIAGGASVDEGAFLALGSFVLPKINVGAWATVGAGAVVTKPVEPGLTVVGVPARPLEPRSLAA